MRRTGGRPTKTTLVAVVRAWGHSPDAATQTVCPDLPSRPNAKDEGATFGSAAAHGIEQGSSIGLKLHLQTMAGRPPILPEMLRVLLVGAARSPRAVARPVSKGASGRKLAALASARSVRQNYTFASRRLARLVVRRLLVHAAEQEAEQLAILRVDAQTEVGERKHDRVRHRQCERP